MRFPCASIFPSLAAEWRSRAHACSFWGCLHQRKEFQRSQGIAAFLRRILKKGTAVYKQHLIQGARWRKCPGERNRYPRRHTTTSPPDGFLQTHDDGIRGPGGLPLQHLVVPSALDLRLAGQPAQSQPIPPIPWLTGELLNVSVSHLWVGAGPCAVNLIPCLKLRPHVRAASLSGRAQV